MAIIAKKVMHSQWGRISLADFSFPSFRSLAFPLSFYRACMLLMSPYQTVDLKFPMTKLSKRINFHIFSIAAFGLIVCAAFFSFTSSAEAAVPTFVASGTPAQGTGNVVPGLPSGIQEGDLLLLFIEGAAGSTFVIDDNGGTWINASSSPQGTGTPDSTTATGLNIEWSRYNGTQGDPTVYDSGNHTLAVIFAFRGVIAVGSPFDAANGNVDATSDTSLSATGATTTVADTLIVVGATLMDDAQNFGATWTNSSLSGITLRANVSTAQRN